MTGRWLTQLGLEFIEQRIDIAVRYPGTLRITLTTHEAGGVTDADVELARTISGLAAAAGARARRTGTAAAGGEAARVVFSGVGKQAHEMRRALEVGIRCFNVESEPELERIA